MRSFKVKVVAHDGALQFRTPHSALRILTKEA